MNTSTEAIGDDLSSLANHARDFVSATADAAGEKLAEGRKLCSDAVDSGKDAARQVRDNVMHCAKSACDSASAHPFRALGMAIGAAALLIMAVRMCTCRRN